MQKELTQQTTRFTPADSKPYSCQQSFTCTYPAKDLCSVNNFTQKIKTHLIWQPRMSPGTTWCGVSLILAKHHLSVKTYLFTYLLVT